MCASVSLRKLIVSLIVPLRSLIGPSYMQGQHHGGAMDRSVNFSLIVRESFSINGTRPNPDSKLQAGGPPSITVCSLLCRLNQCVCVHVEQSSSSRVVAEKFECAQAYARSLEKKRKCHRRGTHAFSWVIRLRRCISLSTLSLTFNTNQADPPSLLRPS